MILLYRLAVAGYVAAIRIAARLGNAKARLWVAGRRGWQAALAHFPAGQQPTLWMHCASLGEFEQGRPVLEALRAQVPGLRVVLSFFSPSGYEVRKHYPLADAVTYLPVDTPANVAAFLQAVQPSLAVVVKYDLWYGYLAALRQRGVPVFLIAANVRAGSGFAGWPARWWYRNVFAQLRHVYAQTPASAEVVRTVLHQPAVSVAGDTRFDRVAQVAEQWQPVPEAQAFAAGRPCLVAGSTWPADERLLLPLFAAADAPGCLILVPHELQAQHIAHLARLPHVLPLSQFARWDPAAHRILLVDRIGLLSRLYRYAQLVWIGGGFGAGIHNTLEAAVYGKPLRFGPRHQRFVEAVGLVACGAARPVHTYEELAATWAQVLRGDPALLAEGAAAARFVQQHRGATVAICAGIVRLAKLPAFAPAGN